MSNGFNDLVDLVHSADKLDLWHIVALEDNDTWAPDESGVYTVINVTKQGTIRVDIMDNDADLPIVTYESKYARAIYKYLASNGYNFNLDHMAYIGYELGKAESALSNGHMYTQS